MHINLVGFSVYHGKEIPLLGIGRKYGDGDDHYDTRVGGNESIQLK